MSEEWEELEQSQYGWCGHCQAYRYSHPGESGCSDCSGDLIEPDYSSLVDKAELEARAEILESVLAVARKHGFEHNGWIDSIRYLDEQLQQWKDRFEQRVKTKRFVIDKHSGLIASIFEESHNPDKGKALEKIRQMASDWLADYLREEPGITIPLSYQTIQGVTVVYGNAIVNCPCCNIPMRETTLRTGWRGWVCDNPKCQCCKDTPANPST